MTYLFSIWLMLPGCDREPCTGFASVYTNLGSQSQPLVANTDLPPFLYVTTTDLDSETSILDRVLLVDGGNGWSLPPAGMYPGASLTAPPFACGADKYPWRVRFELGDVKQQPIDEVLFPPHRVRVPPRGSSSHLALGDLCVRSKTLFLGL